MVTLQYCMMTISNMNEHVNEVGGQPIGCSMQYFARGRRRSICKDCGGGGICEHDRVRSNCKDCVLCEHGVQTFKCSDCICEQNLLKSKCKQCVLVNIFYEMSTANKRGTKRPQHPFFDTKERRELVQHYQQVLFIKNDNNIIEALYNIIKIKIVSLYLSFIFS